MCLPPFYISYLPRSEVFIFDCFDFFEVGRLWTFPNVSYQIKSIWDQNNFKSDLNLSHVNLSDQGELY